MTAKAKSTATLRTFNEERNVRDCLESVARADKIVVVNVESTDRTLRPLYAFLYRYLARLGFLNGLPGFVIAVMGSHGVFLKCMKVREPERRLGRFDA